MKKYTVKAEYADQIFGGECDTAYVEECMKNGMPEEDVMHLVREFGKEVLEQFDIEEEEEDVKRWYAVEENREDNDWGYGSYDLEEAKEMLKNYPEGLIAVIEEGDDPVCVEEITYGDVYGDVAWSEYDDTDLIDAIDNMSEFDADSMDELIKRANLYDEESGILDRWQAEPDGQHDIQSFFDEACEIISAFHKRVGR